MTHNQIQQPLDNDQLVWLIVQIFFRHNLLFALMNKFTEYGAINRWPLQNDSGRCWSLLAYIIIDVVHCLTRLVWLQINVPWMVLVINLGLCIWLEDA